MDRRWEAGITTNTVKCFGISGGTIDKEERIWVSIDWDGVPTGTHTGSVKIARPEGKSVEIRISAMKPARLVRDTLEGFVEGQGYVSIEAEHYTKNIPAGEAGREKIEDYGRTLSAMSIMPMNTPSAMPPDSSPCLEYKMYLFTPGKLTVMAAFAPTLNFIPGRGLRYAVSFDDEIPRAVDIVPRDFDARNGNREWEDSVRNAARTVQSTHVLSETGYHTLKIWMVDPEVVLEKIVVDLGGLKPSYLGPPESYYRISKDNSGGF